MPAEQKYFFYLNPKRLNISVHKSYLYIYLNISILVYYL